MRTKIKNLAEMHALGALSAQQVKEECVSHEEYCMALYYAELHRTQHDEFVAESEQVDLAFDNLISQMRQIGYYNICKNDDSYSFYNVELVPVYNKWDYSVDIDMVEEIYTPIEIFNIIHNFPFRKLDEDLDDIDLPF